VTTRLRAAAAWPSDVTVFDGDALVVAHSSRGEGRILPLLRKAAELGAAVQNPRQLAHEAAEDIA
jgi:hypothetical protein